jgi:UDP-glucose 4-epimerase
VTHTTVVVTGGAGFIGRALVRELVAVGHRVVVLDNLSLPRAEIRPLPRGADLVEADVRDSARVQSMLESERPATVYHLAAIHFIPACEADPPGCISVNTAGAASVLEACARVSPQPACVLASTGAVYAPSLAAHDEADKLAPVDVYGLSKLWMEQIGALFALRHGLHVAVARLFNTYGPGETNPHFIPALMEQVTAGGTVRAGNVDTRRDYVHVNDVVRALRAMAGRTETLNVGSGHALSGHEVIAAIGRAVGRELEVETDASRLRKVDRPLLLSDPSRAADLLGWRAETAFEDGIADLVSGVRV